MQARILLQFSAKFVHIDEPVKYGYGSLNEGENSEEKQDEFEEDECFQEFKRRLETLDNRMNNESSNQPGNDRTGCIDPTIFGNSFGRRKYEYIQLHPTGQNVISPQHEASHDCRNQNAVKATKKEGVVKEVTHDVLHRTTLKLDNQEKTKSINEANVSAPFGTDFDKPAKVKQVVLSESLKRKVSKVNEL